MGTVMPLRADRQSETLGAAIGPATRAAARTVGLNRDQAWALVTAADRDCGRQALRTAAVIRLLLHNALRWTRPAPPMSPTSARTPVTGYSERVVRKGARRASVPLTPATVAALDAYSPTGPAAAGWMMCGS